MAIAAVFMPLACPALDTLAEDDDDDPIAVLDEGSPSPVVDPAPIDPPPAAAPPWPVVSDSFSGEDGPSLEPVSYVIGLYGGISFTLPPFFCAIVGGRGVGKTLSLGRRYYAHQFAVVVLAVAAVLDVVQVVAGLLAQQTQLLGTGHVELLLAARLVALHARAHGRLGPLVQLLANVARCERDTRWQLY